MNSDTYRLFPGYEHLQEGFVEWFRAYTRTCEMGTFAPVWLLDECGYVLVQVDCDVEDLRQIYGLHDDYQFYDELLGDAEILEIWGHNGYGYSAEACLLCRCYKIPYEYDEASWVEEGKEE